MFAEPIQLIFWCPLAAAGIAVVGLVWLRFSQYSRAMSSLAYATQVFSWAIGAATVAIVGAIAISFLTGASTGPLGALFVFGPLGFAVGVIVGVGRALSISRAPNLSLNADVPRAGLRPRSGPPVSLYSLGGTVTIARLCRIPSASTHPHVDPHWPPIMALVVVARCLFSASRARLPLLPSTPLPTCRRSLALVAAPSSCFSPRINIRLFLVAPFPISTL